MKHSKYGAPRTSHFHLQCIYSIYIYMGAWSFPHPYISASLVLRPIQYSANDVLTLVMPHTQMRVDKQANVGTSDVSAATHEHRLSNLFTGASQQSSAMQHSAFPI